MAKDDGNYDVGYAKPPKAHQFKRGQSGNPRGRPKKTRNLTTLVRKVLDETVDATIEGKRKRIDRLEAMIRVLINNAMKGDTRAIKQVADLLDRKEANDSHPYVVLAPPSVTLEEWEKHYSPNNGIPRVVNPTADTLSGSAATTRETLDQEQLNEGPTRPRS